MYDLDLELAWLKHMFSIQSQYGEPSRHTRGMKQTGSHRFNSMTLYYDLDMHILSLSVTGAQWLTSPEAETERLRVRASPASLLYGP